MTYVYKTKQQRVLEAYPDAICKRLGRSYEVMTGARFLAIGGTAPAAWDAAYRTLRREQQLAERTPADIVADIEHDLERARQHAKQLDQKGRTSAPILAALDALSALAREQAEAPFEQRQPHQACVRHDVQWCPHCN